MRPLAGILVLAAALGVGGAAVAQAPMAPATPSGPIRPGGAAAPGHGAGELDCFACHRDKHRAVLSLSAGAGGRGAPATPDRMFSVRVQCVACHTKPTAPPGSAGLGGQTFLPAEQACVTCHGERYRTMLSRWREGFGRMRQSVAPKLAAARAAPGSAPAGDARQGRIRRLVEDAEFNIAYVTLGNGAHNVFYAANLLRRANSWLDEAAAQLGRAPAKTDDALVRGGYCATLCHEPAGRALRETVTFQRQPLPHARHVAELGATCTTCHSADVHRALSATPATCTGCHHDARNDRCESCHRAQSAFYRGQTKSPDAEIAPNRMAEAVPCTACHDFTRKHSRAAVGQTCRGCHDASYMPLMTEWTVGFDRDLKITGDLLAEVERTVVQARRRGRPSPTAETLLKQAREAHGLVKASGVSHNPLAADSLLTVARRKATDARSQLSR